MAMKEYKVIDENGLIVRTEILNDFEEIPENHVLGWGAEFSFFNPKYDFDSKTWVEQKPAAEIEEYIKAVEAENSEIPVDPIAELKKELDSLKNENATLKAENERAQNQMAQTNADLLGFMDFYFTNEGL